MTADAHLLLVPGCLVQGVDKSGSLYDSLNVDETDHVALSTPDGCWQPIDDSVGIVLAVWKRHLLVVLSHGTFWAIKTGGRWIVIDGERHHG